MIAHMVDDNLRRLSQIAFAFNQEQKILTKFEELEDYQNVVILMDEKSAKEHYKNPISLDDFKPKKNSTFVIGKNYPDIPFHEQIPDNDSYEILYIPLTKPTPLHGECALSIVLYQIKKFL